MSRNAYYTALITRRLFRFINALALLFVCGELSYSSAQAKPLFTLTPASDESYAESYTLVARLHTDGYLLVQAMIMNGGIGDEKPACRILYVKRGAPGINEVDREGAWVASTGDGKLRIGACLLRETARGAYLEARTESLRVELDLSGQRGHIAVPKEALRLDDKDKIFEHELIMPWAELSGRIIVKGEAPLKIRGQGTLNHTRSTALPPEISKKFLKVYLFPVTQDDHEEGLLVEIKQTPKDKLIAWSWHPSQKRPSEQSVKSLSLPSSWPSGLKVGQNFRSSKQGPSYQITQLKKVYTYEPIKAYGFAGRLLKRWVGDPRNITSLIEVKSDKQKLEGFIEEITLR